MLLAVDRDQQGHAVALDANFDREGCRRRLAKREKRQGYEAGDDELKGRRSSDLGLSLGAYLDELDARGAAPRALAWQHPVDNLQMAGQTAPGRRRLSVAGANRARLVGHLEDESTVSAASDRRRGEEDVFDACLDGLHVARAEGLQAIDQGLNQMLGGGRAGAHAYALGASQPARIEFGSRAEKVPSRAGSLGNFSKAVGIRGIR